MAAKKTPGVYIVEKNAFPNSVVEVPTAIPAFIGITEKAINGAELTKWPTVENHVYGGIPAVLRWRACS
jgi:phage tail sheath protein FI